MRQVWRHLGFLHWPIASTAIAPLLPPGLEVDTFDGVAYVGVVPFTIPLSRTPQLGLPVAPAFHELNLRTYVHRDGRDPGVWFFSLDAASRLAVAGARLGYHLPYFHARIAMEISDGPSISYSSRRLGTGQTAEFSGRYGPTVQRRRRRSGRSSSSWPSAISSTPGTAARSRAPASITRRTRCSRPPRSRCGSR